MFKRFVRGFSSQFFKFCLLLGAASAAMVVVFGSQTTLKDVLHDSGVYTGIVDSIIEQATKEQKNSESDVPINDPAVQKVIRDTLSPEFLEQTSSSAIDGVFGWLQGKTDRPEFTIDLKATKQRLANGLGDVALARAQKLKPCTVQQLQSLDPNNTDIFSLPCLPPGINLQAERTKLVNQIANGEEFLEDTSITADDLPKEKGQDAFDKASGAPDAYQWLVRMPWILGGLGVVAAAITVFLHDDRRRGIWVIGRALLVTGLVLIIFAVLSNYFIGQIKPANGEIAQKTIADAARVFSRELNRITLIYGGVYTALGAAIMLGIHFTRPKSPASLPDKPEQTSETTAAPEVPYDSSTKTAEIKEESTPTEKPEKTKN